MNTPAPRALIAEDEPLLAAALQHELAQAWPELQVVATVGDGLAAVREALAREPDVLFFDIRMPGQSGLDAAAELADAWPADRPFPALVFVTAYDQYAVQAFEAQAVDYLLKPVQPDACKKQCAHRVPRCSGLFRHPAGHAPACCALQPRPRHWRHRACTAQLHRRRSLPSPELRSHHGPPGARAAGRRDRSRLRCRRPAYWRGGPAAARCCCAPRRLMRAHGSLVPATAARPQITLHDGASVAEVVHYFEAADKYVRVLTAEREYLIRTALKELIEQLDPQEFWQVHRSTLVRATAIATVTRDEAGKQHLSLRGRPERLPVSRLYAHLFKAM